MAAGLTVEADKIAALQDFLDRHLAAQVEAAGRQRALKLDGVLSIEGANHDLVNQLAKAGPYGAGNPEPQFALPHLRVVRADIVGGAHVRCILAGDGKGRLKAIAFRAADKPLGQALLSAQAEPLHVAGKIRLDSWAGNGAVQLLIEDAAWPKLGT